MLKVYFFRKISFQKILLIAFSVVMSGFINSGWGQTTIYTQNFNGLHNWTFDGTSHFSVGAPTAGNTCTAARSIPHILGTVLDGTYLDSWTEANSYAISPSFDCSAFNVISLSYYSYSDFEPNYDYGYVYISGDNGSNWTKVETYSATETGWTLHNIDISTACAGKSQVLIKFTMSSDVGDRRTGWNVDDLSVTGSLVQVTSTAGGGTWSTGSTWVGGSVPGTGVSVIIVGPVNIGANLTQTSAGSVTVNNGGTLTITGGSTTFGALTVNTGGIATLNRNTSVLGATNITGTINFGSTSGTSRTMTFGGAVTLNNGAVWNESNADGIPTFNFSDSFTNNATTLTAQTGTHTFSGTTKIIGGTKATSIPTAIFTGAYTNSGTLTISTSLTVTGAAIRLTNDGTITATTALSGTGGVTQGGTGVLNLGGTSTITTLTATAAGNIVNYTGVAQTAKVTTYRNLTLSGSGTKTFATTPTVNDILSMEGTASIVVTGAAVVTYGANATLQYNKPAAYTATAEEWIATFGATGGVIIANTGTITTGAAKVLSAGVPLTINNGAALSTGATNTWTLIVGGITSVSGTLSLTNTGTKTFTGDVTINSGGTWNEPDVAAIGFAGNFTNNAATFSANTGVHTFSGATKVLSGTTATVIPSATFTGNYSNNGTLTCATVLNVTGAVVVLTNNGTITATIALSGTGGLTQGATGVLNLGGTTGITALTATAAGNTVNYTSAAQTAKVTTYANLTLSGSLAKTFATAPTVNGILSMEGSATLAITSGTLLYGTAATLQYNTATSRTVSTTEWITPFTASGGVVIANTGTITLNAPKVVNAPLMISGGTLNLGAGLTHTCNGVVTLTTGTLNSGSSLFKITGSFNVTGGTFTPGTGTIEYNAAGAQTCAAVIYNNLTLSGSGAKTTTGATINGILSMEGTATTTGTVATYGTAATLQYKGTGAQITGIEFPETWTATGGVIIDNAAGVTLNAYSTVSSSLSINSGKLFLIASTAKLNVTGTLTNNAGSSGFVLQSDAAGTAMLMHNTNNVPATVQRYISGVAQEWHFLSSPVSNQSISGSWLPSGTYANGTGYDLFVWDEPSSFWISKLDSTSNVNWHTVHPGSNFVAGRGYLYSFQVFNPTKAFVGTLNNGAVNWGLTMIGSDPILRGFNMVGNPYPSAVDWQASSGWGRSNLVSSGSGYDMWIWNPIANNYGVCNSFPGSVGTNSVSRYIAPMQGYFVRASGAGTLSQGNAVRVLNDNFWFKSLEQEDYKISLIVNADAGKGFDEIQLGFGYDANENGAMKLFSTIETAPSLYLPKQTGNFSVLYFTNTKKNTVVPVCFTPGMDGTFTITCNFDQSKFDSVLLEDRQTHYSQNMKTAKTYSFQASKTDSANRFVLRFGPDIYRPNTPIPANVYSDGTHLVVDLTLVPEETEVFVYDIPGRLLLHKKLAGEIQHNLDINTDAQILIVYLKNTNGSLCRKLVWGVK